MNILFVCHRLPFPPNRGGKIRPFHMIQHLGRKHSVVLASLAHTEEELREGQRLNDYCEQVIAEVVPNRTRWQQAVRALFSSTPSSVAYFWSRRLSQRIREASKTTAFDAVFVHCAFVAQYVSDLPCRLRILDFGDIDSAKWLAYARHRAFPLSMGYRLEAEKLRRYEREMALQFNWCTVTTRGELEELKRLNVPALSEVIPNGVDLSYFHARKRHPQNSSVIVFLGRMDYFPNIDAVLFFAREVFPLVRRSVPEAEFRIVGSNPSRAVRNLSKISGISVTRQVPDVRPYLSDAAVAVAPLRIARGTQNKILQFLAMGIPTVTTPEAAKGVGAGPGRHFLVAEGSEMFAQRVVELLQDGELRRTFSMIGPESIEAAHSWPASMQILDNILANPKAAPRQREFPKPAGKLG